MKTFHLEDIPYLLAVYEEKSISRAAEKCFLAQPTLSKLVKKYEETLGVELFDRRTLPLSVTEEGRTVLHYLQELSDTAARLERYCESCREPSVRNLTIAASAYFCSYLLPPLLEKYSARYPEASIRSLEANDGDLTMFLKTDFATIGISANVLPSQDFESFLWAEEELVLAVPRGILPKGLSPDFALSRDEVLDDAVRAAKPAISIKAFADKPFLLLREGNDSRDRLLSIFRDAGISPRIAAEPDQLQTAFYMSIAGQGISFVRSSLAQGQSDPDSLRYYRIADERTRRSIRVYHKNQAMLNEETRSFLSFLRREASGKSARI